MSWETITLGDIAEFSNGINFDKSAYGKGIKLIGVSNFGNKFYPDYDELQEIKKEFVRITDYLQNGDIVFVRSNGNKELVGRCMLIDNPCIPVTFSGFCIKARIIDLKKYYPKFFVYHFKSMQFRRSMSGTAIGTNIQNLSQARLSVYKTKIPNYETQVKIASILSAYDDLIENNKKQIKLLEEAAQRLYKEWFVDLRFPGHENVKTVDGVPEGWSETTIDSFIKLQSGYAFKSSTFDDTGNYKIVTIKNVQDGVFDGYNVNRIIEIPTKMPIHCKLNEGDILLSLTGNVGRICLVIGNDYLLNQRVAKIVSEYPYYAYCLFKSEKMFHDMNNLANGAAQQNLSPIRTGQIKTIKPSVELLVKFEQMVKQLFDKKIVLNRFNDLLIQARDRLLPKLMSGEVEV